MSKRDRKVSASTNIIHKVNSQIACDSTLGKVIVTGKRKGERDGCKSHKDKIAE